MPTIRIQHVNSCSSEDSNHPAENLLELETYKKWRCASPGEKQAVVVLQFEKATVIHSIDIGNDGSAFVEVLVGKSTTPDQYQVLLVTSSFMTPVDSKAWTSTNRVRMFGRDKLSKEVAEQKWDRVKIVCSQPFNKNERYGLAFVKFQSPPEEGGADGCGQTKLGAFRLKEEVKDLPSGSLFYQRGQLDKPVSSLAAPTPAAQARLATAAALKGEETTGSKEKPVQKRILEKRRVDSPPATKKLCTALSSPSTKQAERRQLPFEEIMCGVKLSLSGFKNPLRGELREKALEMGAQYEPDWNPKCTHLVCAFANTPKFNQVKAKQGLIVTKQWVLDSHAKRRRLPARSYRLEGPGGEGGMSAEEYDKREAVLFAAAIAASSDNGTSSGTSGGSSSTGSSMTAANVGVAVGVATGEAREKGETEEEEEEGRGKDVDGDEEMDTDEEIRRIEGKDAEDPYDCSTDEAEFDEPQKCSVEEAKETSLNYSLPDFFSKCHFFLYGSFLPPDRRLLVRYIAAYNGHIEDYMGDKVSHVVTTNTWDNSFDEALSENSSLVFVRPKWIFACHQKKAIVPCQPYMIAPAH